MRWYLVGLLVLSPGWLAGCQPGQTAVPAAKPPEVMVGSPVVREVTEYEYFTGRTESAERVEIRARLTGYLDKTFFAEGALVKEGDLLFLIDPRPYKAELDRAEANLAQAQVRLRRADADLDRAQTLVRQQAISREEFDKLLGERDQARAAINVNESEVRLAKLRLDYTEVRAPFAGRISRRLVDPGNLVKADETHLSTLVALDPMYVYFDVDERTLLRQMLRKDQSAAERATQPIQIGLVDEEGYPHAGKINFMDNGVDPATGTMWMRGQFVEPDRSIPPGLFSRVRFPLGKPYQAVLVAEQALGTDQGQRFLYTVDDQNKVSYRRVKAGRLHDGWRVIQEGLKPGERVVISGLQRVRAGLTITPKEVDMAAHVAKSRPENQGTEDTAVGPNAPATVQAAPVALRKDSLPDPNREKAQP